MLLGAVQFPKYRSLQAAQAKDAVLRIEIYTHLNIMKKLRSIIFQFHNFVTYLCHIYKKIYISLLDPKP